MNKRDKIRAGMITTTYDGKQKEYGVVKTPKYEAQPSSTPEWYIRYLHKGHTLCVYGFFDKSVALREYWNIVVRLDENGAYGGATPPPVRKAKPGNSCSTKR